MCPSLRGSCTSRTLSLRWRGAPCSPALFGCAAHPGYRSGSQLGSASAVGSPQFWGQHCFLSRRRMVENARLVPRKGCLFPGRTHAARRDVNARRRDVKSSPAFSNLDIQKSNPKLLGLQKLLFKMVSLTLFICMPQQIVVLRKEDVNRGSLLC